MSHNIFNIHTYITSNEVLCFDKRPPVCTMIGMVYVVLIIIISQELTVSTISVRMTLKCTIPVSNS